jgi:electron transport complex protein RnfC
MGKKRFKSGIHPIYFKELSRESSIIDLVLPAEVIIPLSQHTGTPCTPLVKPGDEVKIGTCIASSDKFISAPIHSSISGKVKAVRKAPHPILGMSDAIIIESDGKGHMEDMPKLTEKEIEKLDPEAIVGIIKKAGIVGLGGAAFPTHVKLSPPKEKKLDTFILNGAECEPYLTGDYRLMVEKTKEILLGIGLAAKCVGAKLVYIAIEDNKPEAIKAMRTALGDIRHATYDIRIVILQTKYPQGGERQLIKTVLHKEVPPGKLPFDVGVVVNNVATVYAIYEAVYFSKPLYERVVTVTGSCLSNPKNLLVCIGTPIRELINFCGPLKEEPAKIIIGGPMMGIAQYTDEVPVIKSTTGILLMNKEEASAQEESLCIRCGACVRECPAGLMPCMINLASQKELWEQAKTYGVLDCIECGLCSYVCPANRRIVQSIKRAKLEVAR